jgi:hypothetical protein
MNKLRRLAISIIEDMEEHIDACESAEEPFNEDNWYLIEEQIYGRLKKYLLGGEE